MNIGARLPPTNIGARLPPTLSVDQQFIVDTINKNTNTKFEAILSQIYQLNQSLLEVKQEVKNLREKVTSLTHIFVCFENHMVV